MPGFTIADLVDSGASNGPSMKQPIKHMIKPIHTTNGIQPTNGQDRDINGPLLRQPNSNNLDRTAFSKQSSSISSHLINNCKRPNNDAKYSPVLSSQYAGLTRDEHFLNLLQSMLSNVLSESAGQHQPVARKTIDPRSNVKPSSLTGSLSMNSSESTVSSGTVTSTIASSRSTTCRRESGGFPSGQVEWNDYLALLHQYTSKLSLPTDCWPSRGGESRRDQCADYFINSALFNNDNKLHFGQPIRKPKRIRTAFSPAQLFQLEATFEHNHYVVGQERKNLASDLGLTETQVKVWFQNRRTKFKRMRSDDTDQLGLVYQLDDEDDAMPGEHDASDCADEETCRNQDTCWTKRADLPKQDNALESPINMSYINWIRSKEFPILAKQPTGQSDFNHQMIPTNVHVQQNGGIVNKDDFFRLDYVSSDRINPIKR